MKLDPVIAALRSDRAPQQASQAAMIAACDAWRADPGTAGILGELGSFGAGAALEDCPRLEALFTQAGPAEDFVAALSRQVCGTLKTTPLGHPPMRHGFNGSGSTLLVARSGAAQLLLHAREPGRYAFDHVTFSDSLRYDAILAGEARAVFVRRCEEAGAEARLWEEPIDLAAGDRLGFDCGTETLMLEQVATRLVWLRLQRMADRPGPSTEHERATGRRIHQASGDLRTSRQNMMVSLLGRMGCTQAAPLLAEMALEASEDSLRWQAMRECLALDTACGFRALSTLARRADDQLAATAGALRVQLIETYPQLRALETA